MTPLGLPVLLTLVSALLVLSAGTAYAFWEATGAGDGAAAAGTATPLSTTTVAASTTSLLYPGGPAAAVRLTVNNPNPYPVTISAVTANGAVTASGGLGACTTTGVGFASPTAGLPFTVPATGSTTVTLSGAAQMSNASENGCQGATFTIPVILSGASG